MDPRSPCRAALVAGWLSGDQRMCFTFGLGAASALLLLAACVAVVGRRCKRRERRAVEVSACALYSFVGNVCNALGAFLSNQLALQVLMGAFMAAVDVLHVISSTVTLFLWFRSGTAKRLRVMKRRRRQNLLSVVLLVLVAGGVYHGSRGLLSPPHQAANGRRLLGLLSHDRTELLGYALGLLSFVISWTSRLPALARVYKGEASSAVHVTAGFSCALSGALYSTAILLYDTSSAFLVKTMPWILTSLSSGALDLTIAVLGLYRVCRGRRETVRTLDFDTECLLGPSTHPFQCSCKSQLCRRRLVSKDSFLQLPKTKSSINKMTDLGQYMDVSSQSGRKVCLKEVRLCREGPSEKETVSTVKVVRVDEPCSSSAYSDTSSNNSELEWDFEEANVHWCTVSNEPERPEPFPLQEWTINRI
ncbi:transmembrane protein 44 [Denticeps clupeoides]|uniref:transmembrane protein 44 n=1 Tax=Denticeps clupeoides TaxID=299321 RepID=UPI0010A47CBE|nr:transmembrane protein 44 [Denticeps clupeoides]